jgi:hypothetical protein
VSDRKLSAANGRAGAQGEKQALELTDLFPQNVAMEGTRVRLHHSAIVLACLSNCLAIQRDSYVGDLKPYPLPPAAEAPLKKLAASSDILILGEIHGTQEVPELVASLLAPLTELGYNTLALEVPNNDQASLLAWARGKSEKIPDFFAHPSGDGRGNAQLLTLAGIAASPPFQWQIICFDESELAREKALLSRIQKKQTGKAVAPDMTDDDIIAAWRERDAAMASNVLREAKSLKVTNKILAICGNLHARKTNDMQEPMLSKLWPSFARVLMQRQPAWRVSSVNIEFYGGTYFNNGKVQTFAKRSLEQATVRSEGQTGWDLVLSLPTAKAATPLDPKHVPAGKAADLSVDKAIQK